MSTEPLSPTLIPELADFDIDLITGFVPPKPPPARLPPAFAAWDAIVEDLSGLIRSRRVRDALKSIPPLDPESLQSVEEKERAFLILTVLANAHVWGGDEPDLTLPAAIAKPLCALSKALDRPPIVHYASMALRNWRLLDPEGPVSADNMTTQVQFLGGVDEDWFFIGSLGVELAGAPLLVRSLALVSAAELAGDKELEAELLAFGEEMEPVLAALEAMRDWCTPFVFSTRVRPFLAGWPAPGLLYEGVWPEPRIFVGGSAGQSSLVQSLDAVLDVQHGSSDAGNYLRSIRQYMPKAHRGFIDFLEARSAVRRRALAGPVRLQEAYNRAVAQIDLFRHRHMTLARDFITIPAGEAAGGIGTGGTDFAAFLGQARVNTRGSRL